MGRATMWSVNDGAVGHSGDTRPNQRFFQPFKRSVYVWKYHWCGLFCWENWQKLATAHFQQVSGRSLVAQYSHLAQICNVQKMKFGNNIDFFANFINLIECYWKWLLKLQEIHQVWTARTAQNQPQTRLNLIFCFMKLAHQGTYMKLLCF